MAHIDYYNGVKNMMDIMKDSHSCLIRRVCQELGADDRADEIVAKYVDVSIKMKKFKDDKAPKHAKTSYMFFCVDKRAELKKKRPDLKFSEIMQILSKDWKKIPEKQKEKYITAAEKDRERYENEVEEYEKQLYSSTMNE